MDVKFSDNNLDACSLFIVVSLRNFESFRLYSIEKRRLVKFCFKVFLKNFQYSCEIFLSRVSNRQRRC